MSKLQGDVNGASEKENSNVAKSSKNGKIVVKNEPLPAELLGNLLFNTKITNLMCQTLV